MAFRVTNRTGMNHSNDAAFRAYVSAFIDDILFGGNVVQTTDTGQVNLTTATKPAVNNYPHYAVFRFNDSLQATAPVFFRLNFGVDGSSRAAFQITLGTGSNGAGTIINPTTTITVPASGNITQTTSTYPSYVCSHPGSINVAFNLASGGTSGHGFWYLGIHRSRNQDGSAQTGEGIVLYLCGLSLTVQYTFLFSSLLFQNSSNNFALSVGSPTSSNPGGPLRVFRHFNGIGGVRPVLEALTVINTEIPVGTIFDARPCGNTNRTYVALGPGSNSQTAGVVSGGSTNYTLAMLYD